jgi:hypothetical protein
MTEYKELQPFPEVYDDTNLTTIIGHLGEAIDDLESATGRVTTTRSTKSWRSPSARPSWDNALEQRAGDLSAAREAMEHFRDVIQTAKTQIGKYRGEYDAAKLQLTLYTPDPRVRGGGSLEDLLNPNPPAPDPAAVKAYNDAVQNCNDIVRDAEICLALCAHELQSLSNGVTFAAPPPAADYAVTDQGNVILPFAPAFGAPRGAIFANGIPVQFSKGKTFEKSVLRALGISGESKSFFRPDANGNYNLPRTKSGKIFRGTFPDSMRLGVLEIKSGTTTIDANSPQIRIQMWVARTLGKPFNLIVSKETPVDPALVRQARATGGSVYTAVQGNTFYDKGTGEYVRLNGDPKQSRTVLTEEEVKSIPKAVRDAIEKFNNKKPPPPPPPPAATGGGSTTSQSGESTHYVTRAEYEERWKEAGEDGVIDHRTPQLPTGPIIPFFPVPVPPIPVPALPGFPFPVPVFP